MAIQVIQAVKPIVLTAKEGNEKYTLEFTRETVVYTNRLGFKISELTDNMEEMLPILFHGAFRFHHKNLTRRQTDDILYNGIGGLTDTAVERLLQLYSQPRKALYRDSDDEEQEKNARLTMEL